METITDTGARYTKEDFDALCVEYEKAVNSYFDLTGQLFDLIGKHDSDEELAALAACWSFVQSMKDHADDLGTRVQSIAYTLRPDGFKWVRTVPEEGWSQQHIRFIDQTKRFLDMRRLVTSKMMQLVAELDDMKAMETFANGGGE